MISGNDRTARGFVCSSIAPSVENRHARHLLEALVRAYGELLAVYSFLHLSRKVKTMSVVGTGLAARVDDIKDSIATTRGEIPGGATVSHALRHLAAVDRLLARSGAELDRGALADDRSLSRALSGAAAELKRSAALLNTATFDTSACCAGPSFRIGEQTHGSTFDLGA